MVGEINVRQKPIFMWNLFSLGDGRRNFACMDVGFHCRILQKGLILTNLIVVATTIDMRPSTQVRCKHNTTQELLFEGVRGLALLPSSRPVSEDIAPNPRAECPIMAALFYYDTFQYSTRVRAPGLDETLGALMFTFFV